MIEELISSLESKANQIYVEKTKCCTIFNECNVNIKATNYHPVVALNLSKFDVHFTIKALANAI